MNRVRVGIPEFRVPHLDKVRVQELVRTSLVQRFQNVCTRG